MYIYIYICIGGASAAHRGEVWVRAARDDLLRQHAAQHHRRGDRQFGETPLGHVGFGWGWKPSFII